MSEFYLAKSNGGASAEDSHIIHSCKINMQSERTIQEVNQEGSIQITYTDAHHQTEALGNILLCRFASSL